MPSYASNPTYISPVPSNDGSVSFGIWYWLKKARDKIVQLDSIPPTYQNFLGNRKFGYWSPTATTGQSFGVGGSVTNAGTVSAVTQASTSIYTQMNRQRMTCAAVNNSPGGQVVDLFYVYRGDAANKGGLFSYSFFGFNALPATRKWAVGYYNTNAVPLGATNPSAYLNTFWLGQDVGDTQIHVISSDGAANSKTALGTGFPTPTINQDYYLVGMYAPPYAPYIDYYIKNLYNGNSFSGRQTVNLPVNTNTLYYSRWLGSNAGAIDLGPVYLESGY